jgi:hypothetical protein
MYILAPDCSPTSLFEEDATMHPVHDDAYRPLHVNGTAYIPAREHCLCARVR